MATTFEGAGGALSFGTGGVLSGPNPTYSVSREDITSAAGAYLHTKFSIDLSGNAVVDSGVDITDPGARYAALAGQVQNALIGGPNAWEKIGSGKLTIEGYGGTGQLIFQNARLTSFNTSEQDETAGVHYIEYSASFEALEFVGVDPTYLLESAEDAWDLTPDEGQYTFANDDSNSTMYKTYTLTHTLSATGLNDVTTGTLNSSAWVQAQNWVKSKLIDTPNLSNVLKDVNNTTMSAAFIPLEMGDGSTSTNTVIDLATNNYKPLNHVRSVQSDISSGSYSVTDVWLMVESTTAGATIDVEVSVETGEEIEYETATVSGSIQGLNSSAVTVNDVDLYSAAAAAWVKLEPKLYDLAKTEFEKYVADDANTLVNTELNKSIGINKTTGTITFDVGYNNISPEIAGAIYEQITVSYDNADGSNDIIAAIGVINRAAGPVIQTFGTTAERSISVSITAKMKKGEDKPTTTSVETIAATYKPSNAYQRSKSESWTKTSRDYSFNIDWGVIT